MGCVAARGGDLMIIILVFSGVARGGGVHNELRVLLAVYSLFFLFPVCVILHG